MKHASRLLALALAAAMLVSLAAPAAAEAETGTPPQAEETVAQESPIPPQQEEASAPAEPSGAADTEDLPPAEPNVVPPADKPEPALASLANDPFYPDGTPTPTPTPDPETIWAYVKINNGTGVRITGIKSALEDRLVLPETLGGLPVTALADFIFSGPGDYKMKTVVLPASLTDIPPSALNSIYTRTVAAFEVAEGNTAFEAVDGVLYTAGKTALVAYPAARAGTSYTVPGGVTEIGAWAFYGASKLTQIVLPDGLTTIGDDAFASSGLTGLRFPPSVTQFGKAIFDNCASFSEVTLSMEVIPDKMFSLGKGLSRVTLENTVKKIGNEAFSNCDSLTSVVIPGSVEVIGSSAFSGCDQLSTVTLNKGLKEIGHRAFADCDALHTIAFPNTLTTIRDGAFSSAGLTGLSLPASVKAIEANAFNGNALTEVTVPAGVTTMGSGVFAHNEKLTRATVENGVTALGDYMFSSCTALTDVSLPSTLASIGSGAFDQCGKLESIVLPGGLTTLGKSAFAHSGLTTIQLPDGIQTLETNVFSWCRSLTQVQLPASLKKIDSWAFEQCVALQRITIPDQVETIDSNAFYWCSALLEVVFEGNAPQATSNPFHVNTGMVFYRPESATGYDKAPWKDLNFKLGPAVALEPKPIDIKLTASLEHSRQDELILWLTADITPRTYDGEANPIAPNGLVTTYIQVEGVDPAAQPSPIHYQGGNSSTFRTFGYNVEEFQGKTISVHVGMGKSTGFEAGTSNFLTGPVLHLSDLAWDESKPFGGSSGAQGFEQPELVTQVDAANSGVTITELDSRSASAKSVTLPAEIDGKAVTSLARDLLKNCVNLETVTLPASLKSIGANCFQGCVSLKEVTFLGDAPALAGDSAPFPNDPILHVQDGATGFDQKPWSDMRREPVALGMDVAYEFLNADDISKNLLLQITVTFDTSAYHGLLPLVEPDPTKLTVDYGSTRLIPDKIEGNVLTVTVPKDFPGGSLIVYYPGDRLFAPAQDYQMATDVPLQPAPVALKSATYTVETAGSARTLWLTPTFDPAVHPYRNVTPDLSKLTATVDGDPVSLKTDGLRVGVALTAAQAGKALTVVLTFPGDSHFLAAQPLTLSADIPALPVNNGGSGGSTGGGGGTSGGGGGGGTAGSIEKQPASSNSKVESAVSLSASSVTQAVQEAAKAGAPVVLKADAPADAAKVAVTLPAKALKTVADSESKAVTLQTPVADIALDAKVLETIQGDGKQDVVVSAGTADTAALPKAAQESLADRPVYDISITSGGKAVSQFGGGTVTVALPYTPVDGEDESTLCVCWVKDDGSTEVVRDSVWKDGKAVFATPHLSTYAIVSRTDSFPDAETHWAGDDIRFSAVRGLLVGMEDGQFQPETKVTGAMAVTVLGRLAGVADAGEAADWAKPHLAWAEEHGYLPQGFDPDAPLPREQLAVLLARSLGGETGSRSLPAYTDQYDISAWALPSVQTVQALGLMQGREDGSFDPQGGLNRAELAAVLHRLLSQNPSII